MICGVGCDLVDIDRIDIKIAKKVLTKKEYKQFDTLPNRRQIEYLAGRFAAKEALVKANPKKSLLSDYEILSVDGIPTVTVEGYRAHVSISHEKHMAMAIAILESDANALE